MVRFWSYQVNCTLMEHVSAGVHIDSCGKLKNDYLPASWSVKFFGGFKKTTTTTKKRFNALPSEPGCPPPPGPPSLSGSLLNRASLIHAVPDSSFIYTINFNFITALLFNFGASVQAHTLSLFHSRTHSCWLSTSQPP